MLGLSKFARLTVLLAKRLQQQQRLAAQILDVFVEHVMPHGAAVIIEANHLEEGPDAPRHVCHAAHGAFATPGNHHLQVCPQIACMANLLSPPPPPGAPPRYGGMVLAIVFRYHAMFGFVLYACASRAVSLCA